MMIEGSGAGSGSRSIPLTSGSGSGRPKNMWIRWIWIRIRIQIRNTAIRKIMKRKLRSRIGALFKNYDLVSLDAGRTFPIIKKIGTDRRRDSHTLIVKNQLEGPPS